MIRRGFLKLVGLAIAASMVPAQGRAATRVAKAAPAGAWTVEWFERDFPSWSTAPKTGYAVRATHRVTGEVRAQGWRVLTAATREARWQQRADMKARMYAWVGQNL